ncbi:hypothetical protein KORDIASMS9_02697 [Kordia sp. SMS9]|uniref:hypothetical protein n=1 Tax=Kordia sp. SMS9 TaxID=2282170 RepID=UPI000E0D13C1|nr:hypothetical protein [Kordia sp. SMS9]AXG70457.1 hypothetical protein KORDIASMS9_02697 [Kordia sp. SMS9]
MAYSKKNKYKRIIDIQEIVKQYQNEGLSNTKIFELHIEPIYRISKRTFDEYLGVPAQRELKKIIEQENLQFKLFDDEE